MWTQVSALSTMQWAQAREEEQIPITEVISPFSSQTQQNTVAMWPRPGPVLHPWLEAAFAGCFLPLLSNLVSLLSHNLQGCSTKRVYLNKETIDPEIHNIWINPASDVHSCNLLYFHPSHSPFPGRGCFPSLPCSYRRSAVSMETQTGSST